jgi:NAD(P)-dependent dehydrogenase (short-subunit alcohol dehydrogenase family)
MADLRGQRVLVLGGSSGIGLATAKLAKDLGAEVTVTGRSEARLAQAKTALGQVNAWVGDITREEDTARAFARWAKCTTCSWPEAERSSAISSCFRRTSSNGSCRNESGRWCMLLAPRPRTMSRGSITLMSGALGSRPAPGAAMKHAVLCATEGLARGLALELAPLRVNAIAPGYTHSPGFESLLVTTLPPRCGRCRRCCR